MRSVSIVFARSLLPISDSAGGFCTQRPGLRAPDEAKKGLGLSNKGMCIRSLTGVRHVSGTRRERRRRSKAGPTL